VSEGHDRLPAGGVLAGEDEQGAEHGGGLAGVEAEPGEDPPVLEVAEAVLDRGAGGGQGLAGLPLGGGGPAGPGGFVPGDDDRVAGAGVQTGEPEAGQGAEPGGTQPFCEVVVAGSADLAGSAAISVTTTVPLHTAAADGLVIRQGRSVPVRWTATGSGLLDQSVLG
jgi:hypothetical protein